MPKFWQFCNVSDGSAELLLYGDIADKSWWGDEVTPKQFAEELNALGAVSEITVRINSGGGDVFAAQTIGNLLEQHPAYVTARIDGLCASAATVVSSHCNKVIAANDSSYMVHPVKLGIRGYAGAVELQEYLNALAVIKENIISLYAKKTRHTKDEVTAWMDVTSWWTAAQAKENGFVDELTDDEQDAVVENRNGVLFVNSVSMNLPFAQAPKFVQDSLTASAAGRLANKKPAGQPEKQQEVQDMEAKDSIKTADDLRKEYQELVDQIEQAAAAAATSAERSRIQSIEDMALPGSEALAAEAKFTKPVSAEDFAKEMVKNAKTQGASYLAQVEKDARDSGMDGIHNAPPADRTGGDTFLDAIRGMNQ
ncbi:head maturation protease, ClpP-related [Pseudoflavonifractor sp. 524-17]|uniref:head maturation protease, ClpP-related n=1 Tax=Pseudoflavonifractor sp. 524-17 TaxID=2304577 RepID=UPI00137A413E